MAEVLESTLVRPSSTDLPMHRLWMSNLDVVAARGYSPLLFFYPPSTAPDFFSPDLLRASLAKVLVSFYPAAGRVVVGGGGRLEIDCSGEGVPFVVAKAALRFEDLQDVVPSPETAALFAPAAGSAEPPCPLVLVKVTFLTDGGAVLGVSVHHSAVDGTVTFSFIRSWCAVTLDSSGDSPVPAMLDRTVLRARSPPTVRCLNAEYTSNPFLPHQHGALPFVTATMKLSRRQVEVLRDRLCSSDSDRRSFSRFQVLTSHVWRCICVARGLSPEQETQLGLAIDFRSRLRPPLPPHFLGNAVMRIPVTAVVGNLAFDPIKYGAERIRAAIDQVDDEYVRSVVDYLELTSADQTGGLSRRGGLPKTKIIVVSWLNTVTDLDFGWGAQDFTTRAQMYGCGFVYLIPEAKQAGGIRLVLSLEPESIDMFRKLFYANSTTANKNRSMM